MRVLFISNDSTERCGVRVFGDLWADALAATVVDITRCDGSYPPIYARGYYLPPNAADYDLIHLNWDPQATNHFLPEHFPPGVPLSVFLHDVPPHSTCPVAGGAALLLAHEPGQGIVQIDHAVPTYRSTARPPHDGVTIGTSGLRGDPGPALIEAVCRRNGWGFSASGRGGRWLTTEEEIDRLTTCDVNVGWYATSGRGKSMAAMFMVAADRPMVLSGSSMFSALRAYAYGFEWVETHDAHEQPTAVYEDLDGLERAIRRAATEELWRRELRQAVANRLSWASRAQEIRAHWQRVVEGR